MEKGSKFRNAVHSCIVLGALTGCATSGSSTLLGSGIGAGLGAGLGAAIDPGPKAEGRIRNVFIGAAAGSLLGGATALITHNAIEGRANDAFEKGKKEGQQGAAVGGPQLLPARVEARYVEETVRGSVFVPGHFEYVIVEPARWSR